MIESDLENKSNLKPKITIKEMLNSDLLVKGGVLLDKKLAEQKVLAEAMEFEMRNRRKKERQ